MEKLKLMTILGTRPEIIRLSVTIKCCDRYFHQILVHTGQNYDYELNQVFFEDLGRHEFLPVRHRRQTAAHSDLPHGSREPLL